MAAGPGFYDAQGVWQYGESTPAGPLFSDYLNLLADSASDAIALDRVHLTSLDLGPLMRRQLDTTNTYPRMKIQTGTGRITGVAAASISETVTFPVAFSGVPQIMGGYIGGRTPQGGSFNDTALVDVAPTTIGKVYSPSTTGLTVAIHRTDAANLSATYDYYYSWIAIGLA